MSPIERTGTHWLVATAALPSSPEVMAGLAPRRASARLRIDHLAAQPAAIAWWIVEQDAKMLMRTLRTKGVDSDGVAGIEWEVFRVDLVAAVG
jgi:hypothetical protein